MTVAANAASNETAEALVDRALSNIKPPSCLTWDLRMLPEELERAFWSESTEQFCQQDFMTLTRFGLVALGATAANLWPQMGTRVFVGNCWQVFAVYLIWILLLTLLPTWYKAHRQHLVAVLRLALGIAQVKFYNAVGYLVYDIGVYENAPLTSWCWKVVFISKVLIAPIEANGHLLPFALNATVLFIGTLMILFGTYFQDVARFGNQPAYLEMTQHMNSQWSGLLKSLMPLEVPCHESLQGRSTPQVLSIAICSMTAWLTGMYVTYMNLWMLKRLWLQKKLSSARQQQRWSTQQQREDELMVHIGGASIPAKQIRRMIDSPATQVLYQPFWSTERAWGSIAAAVFVHLVLFGAVCQAAVVLGEIYVHQLAPRLMSPETFEKWFLLPQSG